MGIIPCAFTALDWLRTESYLLFYPYDNSEMYPFENEAPGDTLWELGLDFTVSPGKTGFRGAEEHYRLKGKERFKIFGVLLEGSEAAEPGDPLYADNRKIGVITCPMVSSLTEKSMAIARMDVEFAEQGKEISVDRKTGSVNAIAHALPFDDPQKTKRMAIG
jgi:aminomethyltransferase